MTEQQQTKKPYCITTTIEQDIALSYYGSQLDPPLNAEEYFLARATDLCNNYLNQYNIDTVPVPIVDVATAYAAATPAQQNQIIEILSPPMPA